MKKIFIFLVLFFSLFGVSFGINEGVYTFEHGIIEVTSNSVIIKQGDNIIKTIDGNDYIKIINSSVFLFSGQNTSDYKSWLVRYNNEWCNYGGAYNLCRVIVNDNIYVYNDNLGTKSYVYLRDNGDYFGFGDNGDVEHLGDGSLSNFGSSTDNITDTFTFIDNGGVFWGGDSFGLSSIISTGTFEQTGGGFKINGMEFSKDGIVTVDYYDDVTGQFAYTFTGEVLSGVIKNLDFQGPGLFKQGMIYNLNVSYESVDGDLEENFIVRQFSTSEEMYLLPNENGECPDNFRKQIFQIPGCPMEFDCPIVCFFPEQEEPDWEVETTTTLSGAIINNNVNVNLDPNFENPNLGTFDPGDGIKYTGTGKTYSGTISKSDFDFDASSNLNKTLSKFSNSFSGTLDNIGNMVTISGIQEKKAIGIFTGAIIENVNNTCEMFNPDGSFSVIGASLFGLEPNLRFNFLQGNSLDYVLVFPQKIFDFVTSPLNNFISLSAVFFPISDNSDVCFLGMKSKVEYQKYLKIVNEGFVIGEKKLITIGKVTYLDYFVLVIFGIIFVFGFIILFSKI